MLDDDARAAGKFRVRLTKRIFGRIAADPKYHDVPLERIRAVISRGYVSRVSARGNYVQYNLAGRNGITEVGGRWLRIGNRPVFEVRHAFIRR
jgi:hypothetical protein